MNSDMNEVVKRLLAEAETEAEQQRQELEGRRPDRQARARAVLLDALGRELTEEALAEAAIARLDGAPGEVDEIAVARAVEHLCAEDARKEVMQIVRGEWRLPADEEERDRRLRRQIERASHDALSARLTPLQQRLEEGERRLLTLMAQEDPAAYTDLKTQIEDLRVVVGGLTRALEGGHETRPTSRASPWELPVPPARGCVVTRWPWPERTNLRARCRHDYHQVRRWLADDPAEAVRQLPVGDAAMIVLLVDELRDAVARAEEVFEVTVPAFHRDPSRVRRYEIPPASAWHRPRIGWAHEGACCAKHARARPCFWAAVVSDDCGVRRTTSYQETGQAARTDSGMTRVVMALNADRSPWLAPTPEELIELGAEPEGGAPSPSGPAVERHVVKPWSGPGE